MTSCSYSPWSPLTCFTLFSNRTVIHTIHTQKTRSVRSLIQGVMNVRHCMRHTIAYIINTGPILPPDFHCSKFQRVEQRIHFLVGLLPFSFHVNNLHKTFH